jgi:hypothetical protein
LSSLERPTKRGLVRRRAMQRMIGGARHVPDVVSCRSRASRGAWPPCSGHEKGPARIPAERAGPQGPAISDAGRANEPWCRPGAAR